jgi:hypothetical protein
MLLQSSIFLGKKTLVFLAVTGVLLVIIFGVSFYKKTAVDAQVVHFFPSTCLGGWNAPDNATGKPTVLLEGDTYTEENSAVYQNNAASLYCGNYEGSLPPETKHTRVALRFSWSHTPHEPLIYPDIAPTVVEDTIASSTGSTTKDIAPTASSTTDTESTEEEVTPDTIASSTATTTTVENTPLEEVSPTPIEPEVQQETTEIEPEPEPAEEAPADESPVSWLFAVPKVYAEETATTSPSSISSDPSGALFKIQYTLDGTTWETLGYVTTISNDVQLEFPEAVFKTVEDISRVQIGIVPLLTIDSAPEPVYLDAIWLEVSYTAATELAVYDVVPHTPQTYDFDQITFARMNVTFARMNATSAAVASTSVATSTATSTDVVFDVSTLVEVRGIDGRYVVLHTRVASTTHELWLFDLAGKQAKKIGDATTTIGAHFGGVKERMLFWYSQQGERIYSYDVRTGGTYHKLLLVKNAPTSTESRRFTFPFTEWELIDGTDQFYFYSQKTGEVSSDENTQSTASFLLQFRLADYLSTEELQAIGVAGI